VLPHFRSLFAWRARKLLRLHRIGSNQQTNNVMLARVIVALVDGCRWEPVAAWVAMPDRPAQRVGSICYAYATLTQQHTDLR
jgi:hypothetical protein